MASFQRQQPQMNMQHEVQRNTEIQRNLVEEEEEPFSEALYSLSYPFYIPTDLSHNNIISAV